MPVAVASNVQTVTMINIAVKTTVHLDASTLVQDVILEAANSAAAWLDLCLIAQEVIDRYGTIWMPFLIKK